MLFYNATIFTGSELIPGASVRVENGRIQELTTAVVSEPEGIDCAGDYLVPGFVDLQVYGGENQFLNASPSAETVRDIVVAHQLQGTTSVVPTLFSASHSTIIQAAKAVRNFMAEYPHGVLGLHVEGPYINPEKRGVHSLQHIRQPDLVELSDLLTQYADVLLLMTIAPEQFTNDRWESLLANKPKKLRLSLGHSNATYAQATQAFDKGTTLVTHLYNAMRGFESREPGVVGAVFDHPSVRSSIVADGFHCDPVAIRLAYRLLGDRLFLISDALLTSHHQTAFELDLGTTVHYDNGRFMNQDNRLAGSAITMLNAIQTCVEQANLPLADVLRMASTVPAEIAGFKNELGRIAPGYVANLVRLDRQLQVKGVWLAGEPLR